MQDYITKYLSFCLNDKNSQINYMSSPKMKQIHKVIGQIT